MAGSNQPNSSTGGVSSKKVAVRDFGTVWGGCLLRCAAAPQSIENGNSHKWKAEQMQSIVEYNQSGFIQELQSRIRENENILQQIANLISLDEPPSVQLRSVAKLLYENEVLPQFDYTLRNWPAEAREAIVDSMDSILEDK